MLKRNKDIAGHKVPVEITLDDVRQLLRSAVFSCDEQLQSKAEDYLKDILALENQLDPSLLVDILCDFSTYFDSVGSRANSHNAATRALAHALRSGDPNAERRSHNTIGFSYFRNNNLRAAKLHLEKAFAAAVALKQPFFELAALANICAMMMEMGLLVEVKKLATKIAAYPGEAGRTDQVLLQNATNGLKACLRTEDLELGGWFHEIACTKAATATSHFDGLTRVYYETNRVAYFVATRQRDAADEALHTISQRWSGTANRRVIILLETSRALRATLSDDRPLVTDAIGTLERLLPSTESLPVHREDVLCALVQLHRRLATAFHGCSEGELRYSRLLREHLVAFNHQEYFRPRSAALGREVRLTNPAYAVPSWTVSDESVNRTPLAERSDVVVTVNSQLEQVASNLNWLAAGLDERAMRTRQFNIAETWAVAAEQACGFTGQRCFSVGRLAALLAAGIGMSPQEALAVEMACRLHDVGAVVLDEETLDETRSGRLDPYRFVQSHTTLGYQLLNQMPDELSELASAVAHHHHEWWNGCGLPDGLLRGEIPLAARICAVANEYVDMTFEDIDREPWTHECAVRQISTMAGVQFDPAVVDVFLRWAHGADLSELRAVRVGSSLERARLALDENDVQVG